jgi:serine/threonine protein kinase
MEYCPGTTLDPFELNLPVIQNLLKALSHMHSLGIIHRDIKPENIIVDGDVPKLIDFGLSKDTWDNTRLIKSICGTKAYMPPEGIRGESQGQPVDIWSLGIILHVMVVGKYPWITENDILNMELIFPEGTDSKVVDLISKMLDRNSTTRIKASEAISHPIFSELEIADIYPAYDQRAITSKLQYYSLKMFANMIEKSKIKPLTDYFLHNCNSDGILGT